MTPEAIPEVRYFLFHLRGNIGCRDLGYLLRVQHRYHRRFPNAPPTEVARLVMHTLSRMPEP